MYLRAKPVSRAGKIAPSCNNHVVVMLTSFYLQKKSSEVYIKARSTPASLLFKGLLTEHTTVKWSIDNFIALKGRESNSVLISGPYAKYINIKLNIKS